MATIVTKTIGTAGRDYSTIEAWIAACPADLTAADQVWKGECYNDSAFALASGIISFSGKTTDATRYMWLTAAAGQSFQDHATKNTNAIRYDESKGVSVSSRTGYNSVPCAVTCPYTLIQRIQFIFDYSSHQAEIQLDGVGSCIRECIVYRTSTYGNSGSVINLVGDNTLAANVVVIDDAADTPLFGFNSSSAVVVACTAIRPTYGSRSLFSNGYANPLIRNCVGIGAVSFGRTAAAVKLNAASDYNATDLPASPDPNVGQSGTHHIYNLAPATAFTVVDVAGASDARPKEGSLLIVAGLADTAYTLGKDLMGNARSASTPTIGAVEYLGAAMAAVAFIPFRNTPSMGPIFAQ